MEKNISKKTIDHHRGLSDNKKQTSTFYNWHKITKITNFITRKHHEPNKIHNNFEPPF